MSEDPIDVFVERLLSGPQSSFSYDSVFNHPDPDTTDCIVLRIYPEEDNNLEELCKVLDKLPRNPGIYYELEDDVLLVRLINDWVRNFTTAFEEVSDMFDFTETYNIFEHVSLEHGNVSDIPVLSDDDPLLKWSQQKKEPEVTNTEQFAQLQQSIQRLEAKVDTLTAEVRALRQGTRPPTASLFSGS